MCVLFPTERSCRNGVFCEARTTTVIGSGTLVEEKKVALEIQNDLF